MDNIPSPTASGWRVPYMDMRAAYAAQREHLLARLDACATDARLILRDEVAELEEKVAHLLGVRHAVGVANGTDALYFALRAAGVGAGDRVITVAHTFVATLSAIVRCGAEPVLVDIRRQDFNMDPALLSRAWTPGVKAVLPVHLNGRCCDMDAILDFAGQRKVAVVEDAAQAFGATWGGQCAGSFGLAGSFSFHPMKVLACLGDGGMVVTNDQETAQRFRLWRNHGLNADRSQVLCHGFNSRLDNLQAAVLLVRLEKLEETLARRRTIARQYLQKLAHLNDVELPATGPEPFAQDVVSSFVIQTGPRDRLAAFLRQQGIETFIHWSPPLHRQAALRLDSHHLPVTEAISARVLSLPLFPEMSDAQVDWVVHAMKTFFL